MGIQVLVQPQGNQTRVNLLVPKVIESSFTVITNDSEDSFRGWCAVRANVCTSATAGTMERCRTHVVRTCERFRYLYAGTGICSTVYLYEIYKYLELSLDHGVLHMHFYIGIY